MPISALLYIAIYLLGIILTLFKNVSWGINLYQFHYFTNPAGQWWQTYIPEWRYSLIISTVILIVFILTYSNYNENKIWHVPQAKWLLFMAVMMGVISFWAVWPEKHIVYLVSFLKLIIFIGIVYKVTDSPTKLENIFWTFLFGNFYVGWSAHFLGRNAGLRLDSIGMVDATDANDASAALITSIPLLIFYLVKGKKWYTKLISFGFLIFIIDALVLYNSRGAFLGIITSLSFMNIVMLIKGGEKSRLIPILFGTFLFMAICYLLVDQVFVERMSSLTMGGDASGASRTMFWMKGFDLVKTHPFGLGAWGFQYLSPQLLSEEFLTGGIRALHSTYFQVLVEFGYGGLAIFGALIVSNFRLGIKTIKHAKEKGDEYLQLQVTACLAGLVGFLTAAMFIDRLYAETLYWQMLFVACLHNVYVVRKSSIKSIQIS